MSICSFFGHRDCSPEVKPMLTETILQLIAEGVDTFYVGDKGHFDGYVRGILREAQEKYPHIQYSVVLAYLPKEQDPEYPIDYSDTIYPEGIEIGPPRFAIDRRNRWMLAQADTVVCYINYGWGGAAKYAEQAVKKHKRVINLGKYTWE